MQFPLDMDRNRQSRVLPGLLVVMVLGSIAGGCSATTPRLRSDNGSREKADAEWDSPADSVALAEDIVREDDRKVDLTTESDYLKHPPKNIIDDTPSGISRDKMLLDIISFLKVPYRYGGSTRDGIDCSAFTSLIFASVASVALPRSASEQYRVGDRIAKPRLRFGDLVFFHTRGRRVSHVGIFLENDIFVHASVSEGVTFSSLESKYYKTRYAGARRVIQ